MAKGDAVFIDTEKAEVIGHWLCADPASGFDLFLTVLD